MSMHNCLPLLLAQAQATAESAVAAAEAVKGTEEAADYYRWIVAGITLAVIILPYVVGKWIAKSLRMPDYGWKLGLILCTICAAIAIVSGSELRFGVDLKGGSNLIYELEDDQTPQGNVAETDVEEGTKDPGPNAPQRVDNELVRAISERINPAGTKETVVRPYGQRQIEIIIPETSREVDRIKEILTKTGVLEFRIVAEQGRPKHAELISQAREQASDPLIALQREVRSTDGELLGYWVEVPYFPATEEGDAPLKVFVDGALWRNPQTGEIIDLQRSLVAQFLKANDLKFVEILMAKDQWDVKGDHLASTYAGVDEYLNPSVKFRMQADGAALFQELTREYSPERETGRKWFLGIIMDGDLLSAPTINSIISDNGEISGRFTVKEVESLVSVLQAGKLPRTLKKQPITENQTGATLGFETIRKGTTAIGVSLVAVLLFVLFYYRFAGLVAATALMSNLLFTLALMMLLKAPLTLPGLAGLVLTVGMSVDANVLIFERIREELSRGSALRMAIRNGFGRAMTTIIDSNLTTLITGVVLYSIGTDQIKGFAVTLILGILMSMFTAIFCARVAFDIAERKRWITRLSMMQLVGNTRIDFVRIQKPAIAISILLIIISVVGVVRRGPSILDIDFLGGVSVTMTLDKPLPDSEVRPKISQELDKLRVDGAKVDYNLSRVFLNGQEDNTCWKIDASLQDENELKSILERLFPLAHYSMSVGEVRTLAQADVPGASGAGSATTAAGASENGDADENRASPDSESSGDGQSNKSESKESGATSSDGPSPDDTGRRNDLPSDTLIAQADEPAEPTATDAAEPAAEPESDKDADAGEAKPASSPDGDADSAPSDSPATTDSADEAPAPKNDDADNAPASSEAASDEPASNVSDAPETDSSPDDGGASARESGDAGADSAADNGADNAGVENAPATPTAVVRSSATLSFAGYPISEVVLQRELAEAAAEAGVPSRTYTCKSPDEKWAPESTTPFSEWEVTAAATPDELQRVFGSLERRFESAPIWLSSSKIGGQVATDTQWIALNAMLASLLVVVAYIWFRFQRLSYGIAAVVALVHDVLITLGAIAVSYWLAGSLGFLLVDEFKISLPVVAAFLTLIGYSLNDTIVVFDRIREVKGRSPKLTREMINASVNQTLSRTLLTSLTTLIVVAILYFIGGEGIHGFAFSLVIGIIAGSYSSIFIAAPILLWMADARDATAKSAGA